MITKDLGMVTAYAYAVSKGYTGTEEEFAELMASYASVAQEAVDAALAAAQSAQAAESAKDTAQTTVNGAIAGIQAEGQTQVGVVQAEGTTQVGAVQSEGTTQVGAVQAKGTEVLNSIPSDYTALTGEVTDLKSAISESTYNLVTGVMADTNISSAGRLEYDANLLVFYAPVENGKYYTVLTNESSMVCSFYDSIPTPGAFSYNQQRIIQPSKTIQAPINGFLACRATKPYNTPQIVLGQEQKDYLPRTTATDFIARTAANKIPVLKTEIDSVSEKIITPELEFYSGISSGYSLFSNTDDEYYSVCIVPANTSLTKLSLLAGANTTPTVVLAYMDNNQLTYEWHKNLGTQTAETFQNYDLNYTTVHECYLFLNKFGFAKSSTHTDIPMLATIRNSGTNIVSWSNGSAALDYTAIVYYSNDVSDFDKLSNKVNDLETNMESVPSVPMMASDIAMFENIGFCGDSYMAGMIVVSENPTVTAQNTNLCWGKILERTHGINAFIYAKGGAKASDFITDTDCLPKLLSETAKQLYVISLGHNDAYNRTSVASFKTSYETILDSILEHAPNAKIILCRQSKGYGDMNNGAELNNAISEIGAEYNIPVLDPEDDPYLSSAIYVQTQVHNHPVFSGYAGMAEAFNRLFNKATVDYWDYFKGYTGL